MQPSPDWVNFYGWCQDFCRRNEGMEYHYIFGYHGEGDSVSINGVQFYQSGYMIISDIEKLKFKRSYDRMKNIIIALFQDVPNESRRIDAGGMY